MSQGWGSNSAEGIETSEQRDYRRDRGVRLGRGYLFGRPMPLDDLIALLEQETSCTVAVAS